MKRQLTFNSSQFTVYNLLHRLYSSIVTCQPPTVMQRGQALITLIFFVLIAGIVSTAAVMLMIVNVTSASKLEQSMVAYSVAESGVENGILRLLRDPNYTGETGFAVGTGTADITVTPGNPITITSTGTDGDFTRTVEVTLTYTNGIYTITTWKEI